MINVGWIQKATLIHCTVGKTKSYSGIIRLLIHVSGSEFEVVVTQVITLIYCVIVVKM